MQAGLLFWLLMLPLVPEPQMESLEVMGQEGVLLLPKENGALLLETVRDFSVMKNEMNRGICSVTPGPAQRAARSTRRSAQSAAATLLSS